MSSLHALCFGVVPHLAYEMSCFILSWAGRMCTEPTGAPRPAPVWLKPQPQKHRPQHTRSFAWWRSVGSCSAMSFSPEQLQQIFEMFAKAQDLRQKNKSAYLDERHFRRIETFKGKDAEWKDWIFRFHAALARAEPGIHDILKWVERAHDGVTAEEIDVEFVEEDTSRYAAELFGQLVQLTDAEALTAVKGAVNQNGFLAWKNLYRRYNPITPARALATLAQVLKVSRVSDVCLLPKAIDEREIKVGILDREFGETLSDKIRAALLCSMCPPDVQDLLYQHADALKTYEATRDRVKSMVSNRIARNMPTPMDVGGVGGFIRKKKIPKLGTPTATTTKVRKKRSERSEKEALALFAEVGGTCPGSARPQQEKAASRKGRQEDGKAKGGAQRVLSGRASLQKERERAAAKVSAASVFDVRRWAIAQQNAQPS